MTDSAGLANGLSSIVPSWPGFEQELDALGPPIADGVPGTDGALRTAGGGSSSSSSIASRSSPYTSSNSSSSLRGFRLMCEWDGYFRACRTEGSFPIDTATSEFCGQTVW
uniref:Uncharacterized protein n=1 Tax=Anopheles melas TaxID=34690 RepID=A0A182U7Z0_9DIPT